MALRHLLYKRTIGRGGGRGGKEAGPSEPPEQDRETMWDRPHVNKMIKDALPRRFSIVGEHWLRYGPDFEPPYKDIEAKVFLGWWVKPWSDGHELVFNIKETPKEEVVDEDISFSGKLIFTNVNGKYLSKVNELANELAWAFKIDEVYVSQTDDWEGLPLQPAV